jgi:hypothetical protein
LKIPDDFLGYDEDDLYLSYAPSTLSDPFYNPILTMYNELTRKSSPFLVLFLKMLKS